MISDELKEALGHVAQGDIEPALPVLEREAAAGSAEAQFALGSLYANGQGVDLNYRRAAELIRSAADQGIAQAQMVLAWLYTAGYGVEADEDEARRLYLAAAEGGDPEAQLAVAVMYQFGRHGTEKDPKEMLRWYQAAAEQDHARAQFALGKLMAEGKLVAEDTEGAFMWLTLAIMNGSEPAKQELAMLTGRLKSEEVAAYKERMMERLGTAAGNG